MGGAVRVIRIGDPGGGRQAKAFNAAIFFADDPARAITLVAGKDTLPNRGETAISALTKLTWAIQKNLSRIGIWRAEVKATGNLPQL